VPLPRLGPLVIENGRARSVVKTETAIAGAQLHWTADGGPWQKRQWDALPVPLPQGSAGRVKATLPEGVTVYYLNLFDDRDCAVSTEHEEIARP